MFRERREGWIGVDRGSGSVKVAQVRRAGDGLRVGLAAVTPRWKRGADVALGENQQCRRELDSIRAVVGSWRTRQAAATASMGLCTLSTTDDEAARPETPSCADAWQATQRDRYTLSVPEAEVGALCDGFRLAGLQCRVIDGAPLAIARALRLAPWASPGALVAGLDWGVSEATVVAAKDGHAVYARKLNGCGFGDVIESVASTLGLTSSETETLLRRHGFSASRSVSGVAATVSDALAHATTSLLTEARRTLSHLSSKLKTKAPERLFGFGVGAVPRGLLEHVGERLGIRAEPWSPEGLDLATSTDAPACLFGQAIALSTLAWEGQPS